VEGNLFTSTLELMIDLTDPVFLNFVRKMSDYRFERSANGELIIMSPTGSETSNCNILSFNYKPGAVKIELELLFSILLEFKLPIWIVLLITSWIRLSI
jgi:hypothetical protein